MALVSHYIQHCASITLSLHFHNNINSHFNLFQTQLHFHSNFKHLNQITNSTTSEFEIELFSTLLFPFSDFKTIHFKINYTHPFQNGCIYYWTAKCRFMHKLMLSAAVLRISLSVAVSSCSKFCHCIVIARTSRNVNLLNLTY